jgi:hypothetical protein
MNDDMARMSLTCSKRDWAKFTAWAKKENELIILPCPLPWCKGVARTADDMKDVWVECTECECMGPAIDESEEDVREKAIRAWNAGR